MRYAALLALALLTGCAAPRPTTLYQRLGGEPAISAVVGEMLVRAAVNPVTREYFADADMAESQRQIAIQLCEATGGPCRYQGRKMRAAHAGMDITDAAFDALVADLQAALGKFQVPEREQQELLALLAPMRADIVNYP